MRWSTLSSILAFCVTPYRSASSKERATIPGVRSEGNSYHRDTHTHTHVPCTYTHAHTHGHTHACTELEEVHYTHAHTSRPRNTKQRHTGRLTGATYTPGKGATLTSKMDQTSKVMWYQVNLLQSCNRNPLYLVFLLSCVIKSQQSIV